MQKRLETIVRGSHDFPFQKYSFEGQRCGEILTALHWHGEIEIIHIINGEIEMRVESKAFSLKSGEICFVNPNELHSISVIKPKSRYNAFVFSPEILRFGKDLFFNTEITEKIINGTLKLPLKIDSTTPLYSEIDTLLTSLSLNCDRGQSHRALALSNIIAIFATLYTNGAMTAISNTEKTADSDCIRLCTDYFKQHFSERITLKQISDICFMSPNYLCAYFKKYTGITPFEQLGAIRINEAKKLLINGEHSVTETALLCGFESVGYFIKVFKKSVGVTPNAYKKENTY